VLGARSGTMLCGGTPRRPWMMGVDVFLFASVSLTRFFGRFLPSGSQLGRPRLWGLYVCVLFCYVGVPRSSFCQLTPQLRCSPISSRSQQTEAPRPALHTGAAIRFLAASPPASKRGEAEGGWQLVRRGWREGRREGASACPGGGRAEARGSMADVGPGLRGRLQSSLVP